MSGKLLALILLTINRINKLSYDISFNEMQIHFLRCIANEARAMLEMLGKLPDVTLEKVQQTLDFQSRSHLNVIIGYCDALLDEDEGALSDNQREQLDDLLDRSYEILSHLTERLTD